MDKTEFGSNSEVNKLGNLTSNAKIENIMLKLDQKNIFNNENVYINKEDNFNNDIKDNKTSYNQETGTVIQLQKDSLLQDIVKDCKTEEEFCNLVQQTSAKILEIFENIKAGQQVNAQQLMSEFKTELEQNMFQQAIINCYSKAEQNNNTDSIYFKNLIDMLDLNYEYIQSSVSHLIYKIGVETSSFGNSSYNAELNPQEIYLGNFYKFYLTSIYEILFFIREFAGGTNYQLMAIDGYIKNFAKYNSNDKYINKLKNLADAIYEHVLEIPDSD